MPTMVSKPAPFEVDFDKGRTSDGRPALTVNEFAIFAGLHISTVYLMAERGEIRVVRAGKKILIPVREVARWLSGEEA